MRSYVIYQKSPVAPVKSYFGTIVDDDGRSCLMILDNGEYRRFLSKRVIVRVDRRPVYATILVGYANVQVK